VTSSRTLLISLRPRYAEAILTGDKTIEIRRRPINATPGTPIILYASSPARAVVGTARLAHLSTWEPDAAWRRHQHALGLSREEFDTYLNGATAAYLLHLTYVQHLNEPLPLQELREDGPFHPPQSFRYLTASDPSSIRDLVEAGNAGRRDGARYCDG
jgi:predicted transcriptional regulator